jgi:plasmid stability protein
MSREEGAVVAVAVLCTAILFVRALPYDTQVNTVGVVVGLVGGGFLNWWFSRRTEREVRIILRAMVLKEEGEEIEFNRNARGEIVGFHLKRDLSDAVSVSDTRMGRKVKR